MPCKSALLNREKSTFLMLTSVFSSFASFLVAMPTSQFCTGAVCSARNISNMRLISMKMMRLLIFRKRFRIPALGVKNTHSPC